MLGNIALVTLLPAFAAAQTVWLAGDSTMAATGANDGDTAGWGQYLPNYISLSVNNNAIGGRSARSFTREGRFTTIINSVKSGDYVIIEFGHNDGGSLSTDNGRTDCSPGTAGYNTTCSTVYNGVSETVLTFEKYEVNAANSLKAKGANVILSSQTPNNVCESGTWAYGPTRFVNYTLDAATETSSTYVDHGLYMGNLYKTIGCTTVATYYPNDHTHTSPEGANQAAKAFVQGLQATSSTLKNYIK